MMSRPKQHKNRRILVIDDNQAIHRDFRKILCPQTTPCAAVDDGGQVLFVEDSPEEVLPAFEVDSAYQGQEGLERVKQALAEKHPYALGFVDVRMPPGWDGIETTSRLREVDPDLEIVICTAYSDYSWGEMAKRLGASDRLLILKKPFDVIEVLQLAHALTEKWWQTRLARDRLAEIEQMARQRILDLQSQVKQLSGLLPICASCKRIRDDQNYWHQVESYITTHTDAKFTHGYCPDCFKKLMSEIEALEPSSSMEKV